METPGNLTKLYYSIGEVADMFNVSSSLLRYWESEFSELKIKKNRKGDRQFQTKDIEKLAVIYTLLKERGFTIEGAKKELKRKPVKSDNRLDEFKHKNELLRHLQSIRKGIDQLKKSL